MILQFVPCFILLLAYIPLFMTFWKNRQIDSKPHFSILDNYASMWWIYYDSHLILTQLSIIFLCFVIVKLKSSDDILQGLSMLDNLLKVSVFQVYKDRSLEDAKNDIDAIFE